MPLPSPEKKEDQASYMKRCMTFLADEKRPNDQKVAMCMTTYRNAHKSSSGSIMNDIDFCYSCDKYLTEYEVGFEEEITENNFYIPKDSEYVSASEINYDEAEVSEWDVAAERPGLWENIRKKKQRLGKKYKPTRVGDKDRPDPEAWKRAQQSETRYKYKNPKTGELYMFDKRGSYKKDGTMLMYLGEADYTEESEAAEYQGRKVKLGKPFRTPDGPKKFSVYVKNDKGNVVKVNFGDPNMKIKKNIPERRKSFRARHNCQTPGPKWKSRYWACRSW